MISRDWLTMTTLAYVAAFQGNMMTVRNAVKVDIDELTITMMTIDNDKNGDNNSDAKTQRASTAITAVVMTLFSEMADGI